MRIKSVRIENFRGLRDERIEFHENLTVFAGRNGSGKSTVLEAIAMMLSWMPVRISNCAGGGKKIKPSDIRVGADYAKISMTLSRNANPLDDITLTLYKNARGFRGGGTTDMSAAENFGDDMRVRLDGRNASKTELPVFAHYGASRESCGCCAPHPEETDDRTLVYRRAFAAGSNFKKMAAWFVHAMNAREYEMQRLSRMPLKKANAARDALNRKYAVLTFVRRALTEFSEVFDDFCVRDGALFLKSKNIPAKFLSEGEKMVAALLSDIAMRMVAANPHMYNPLESNAVILIDEIDLHLHPEWQSSLAEKLPRIFPRAQFIISSHSPSVMAAARSLYRLNDSAPSGRFEKVDSPYGRNPSDLLSSVLNAHRESPSAAKIAEMYAALDASDFERAQAVIDELNKMIPEDPEVLRGEYLLRALKPKGGA